VITAAAAAAVANSQRAIPLKIHSPGQIFLRIILTQKACLSRRLLKIQQLRQKSAQ
jgi:hypothetical protein